MPLIRTATAMTSQKFTLDSDNPCAATIHDSGGNVLYRAITTDSGPKMLMQPKAITEIFNASGKVLATLEWHDVLGDKVTFGDGKPVALKSWWKKTGDAHNR